MPQLNDESLPSAHQQSAANKMIRDGNTFGMVMNYLKTQELSDDQCDQVLLRAVKIDIRRKKRIGIYGTLLGTFLTVIGLILYWRLRPAQLGNFGFVTARIPITISMSGLIVLVYGVVSYRVAD